MKKILLSIAAVATLGAAAAPALAQPYQGGWNHGGYSDTRLTTAYVDSLDWKITNAVNEGRISRGEARDLRAQFKSVQTSAWRIQTGRASRGEAARLQAVVNRIEAAVNTPRTYAYGYRR